MQITDNEGTELNVGDEVILTCFGCAYRAWFYELRRDDQSDRALFSSTDPKKAVNYIGYENISKLSPRAFRAIKV